MSIPDWATTISGVLALLAAFGVIARVLLKNMIKDYLSELKPNGGSSLKDKVNTINDRIERLENRVDSIYSILITKGK